ncbi:MAG: DUF5320 domain-containing protein [Acidobacteriota bacterium]
MPFMDGTGPLGNGPGSGRRFGQCAGAQADLGSATQQRLQGRGMRMQRRLRGRAAAEQMTALEQEAGWLERRLDWIRQQASGLGGKREQQS